MRKPKLQVETHAMPLWDMLSDARKVELAQALNLQVIFVETPFGTEIRLEGINYGEGFKNNMCDYSDNTIENYDRFMSERRPAPRGKG